MEGAAENIKAPITISVVVAHTKYEIREVKTPTSLEKGH